MNTDIRGKLLSSYPEVKRDGFLELIEENDISAEDVALIFLNWHGTQLITKEFVKEIEDEGFRL